MRATIAIALVIWASAQSGLGQTSPSLPVSKLMDTPLRDTSICRGPDGTWYLTGTVEPFWSYNEGIQVWKAKELFGPWQPLGWVWKYGDSPWHQPYLEAKKPLWAPEIHYLKGTFWLTYSLPGWDGTAKTSGCGLLRSTSGRPEGPYADVQPEERLGDEIDASLFQEDDGSVYFLWHSGKIARMKPDLSGLAEPYHWLKTTASDPNPQHHSGLCAGIFGKDSFDHVGYEGMFLFKRSGRYYLCCSENFEGRYSCTMATSTNLLGPYGPRYEAIPHAGHNVIFQDEQGQWWSSFFGSDAQAPWQERPGVLPIEFTLDGQVQPQAKPNILFILSDDQGWADVGWHGTEIKTPNLDRIAAAGAKLEQFYVMPVCSPTRAALMTGRYPMRLGLQTGVIRPFADYGLPLEERTLPQALKEVGYTTAICGKWHLGLHDPAFLPTRRGFDHQYGHYCGALDYFTHMREGGFDWHRDDQVCRDEGYSTFLIAQEAVRLIRQQPRDRPLFLYVPFNAVHAPHQVPESYKTPYAQLPEPRRTYAGMVAAMDEAVGQILDTLDAQGLRDDTLIIFSSDNGGPSPGRVTSNGPLRAGKGTLYEGGVRVCATAAWPGRIPAGITIQAPIHIVDWYPTLLRLAGASLDQPLPLDGRDIWPTLAEGKPSPHSEILLNTEPQRGAIRVGDWKLVLSGSRPANLAASREPRRRAAEEKAELFNLAQDPGEERDLSRQLPDKVQELRDRYDAWAAQAVPPRNKPQDPDFKVPKVWGQPD